MSTDNLNPENRTTNNVVLVPVNRRHALPRRTPRCSFCSAQGHNINRCDDMFVIHRLIKHPTMKFFTMVGVEKIKDTDTGGKHTELNFPVLCNYNYGVGFTIESIDPLQKLRPKQSPIFKQQKKLDIWDELNKKANQ